MTREEFVTSVLTKGLFSNEKTTFQYDDNENEVVFSMERRGHPATKLEASVPLADTEAIERELTLMVEMRVRLEAMSDDELYALDELYASR